ncbi:MAG: hypothetical protein AB7E49_05940 [Campylobacterales bacterium]
MRRIVFFISIVLFLGAAEKITESPDAPEYWLKNLNTYFRVPKEWFFEQRFENDALSYYVTKDKFDENGRFKIGFSLHYIPKCSTSAIQNPLKLTPSDNAKNMILNLANNMGKKVIAQPYTFKDNHLIGFGVTVADNEATARYILLGDNENDVCLRMMFEAPNEKWNEVVAMGNAIIESHWQAQQSKK